MLVYLLWVLFILISCRYIVLTMVLGTLSLWVEVFKDHYSFQFQRVVNRYVLFVNDTFLFLKVSSGRIYTERNLKSCY